MDSVFWDIYC